MESEVEIPAQSEVFEENIHEEEVEQVEKEEIPEIESQDIKLEDETVDIIASEASEEKPSEHMIVAEDNPSDEQTEPKQSGEKLSNYPDKKISPIFTISDQTCTNFQTQTGPIH